MKATAEKSKTQCMEISVKKRKRYGESHWSLALMGLPGILLLFVFNYIPMGGLIIAFKDYKYNLGIFRSSWNGIKNFRIMFSSNTFFQLVRNTIGYNMTFILLTVFVSVCVALLLDNISSKRSIKVMQSSMFLPYFLSWIVVSYVSHACLDYNSGIINTFLSHIGKEKISFYSEPKYWPFILVLFNTWKTVGFNSLVYYGTILSIDTELYEAAMLDGCGYLKRVRYITIPHLRPTIITMLLLSLGSVVRSDYGLFFYLPKDTGVLYSVTDVLDTYILRTLRVAGSVGQASAAGFLQSIVGLLLVVAVNAAVRKYEEESALF